MRTTRCLVLGVFASLFALLLVMPRQISSVDSRVVAKDASATHARQAPTPSRNLSSERNATVTLLQPRTDVEYMREVERWIASVERFGQDVVLLSENEVQRQVLSELTRRSTATVRVVSVEQEFAPCDYDSSIESVCRRTRESDARSDGYKRMCRLWYSAVWKYLSEYNYVLRLDLDNTIVTGEWPENIHRFGTVKCVKRDSPDVTDGLSSFFGHEARSRWFQYRRERVYPYTNVMFINVQWVLSNGDLQKTFEAVERTNCICINRWGDLPLWGETLASLGYRPQIMEGWLYRHGTHRNKRIASNPASCRRSSWFL